MNLPKEIRIPNAIWVCCSKCTRVVLQVLLLRKLPRDISTKFGYYKVVQGQNLWRKHLAAAVADNWYSGINAFSSTVGLAHSSGKAFNIHRTQPYCTCHVDENLGLS